jgi:hypothetical protein
MNYMPVENLLTLKILQQIELRAGTQLAGMLSEMVLIIM